MGTYGFVGGVARGFAAVSPFATLWVPTDPRPKAKRMVWQSTWICLFQNLENIFPRVCGIEPVPGKINKHQTTSGMPIP